MSVLLNECKEITTKEYYELPGTREFIGQLGLDSNDMYWMICKSEGIMYKVHCKL